MELVFLKLLNMSIAASWLIIVVILLRLVLRKAPKWLICVLWGIVALRLAVPVSLESFFSLVPSAETFGLDSVQETQHDVKNSRITSVAVHMQDIGSNFQFAYNGNSFANKAGQPSDVENLSVNSGIPAIDKVLGSVLSETFAPASEESENILQKVLHMMGILWLGGFALIFSYGLFRYLRLQRKVREAVPLWRNIWICDAVSAPFILGFIRPRIYLSSSIQKEKMEYMISHEKAHLKRGDHWWKLLGYFLLAVYWFNPLSWAAYFLLCRDIEFACDEKVVNNRNLDWKKAYSEALLSCGMQKKLVTVCPLAFGEVGVKERVKKVIHYKKPAFLLMVITSVICIAAAVCFLTNTIERNETEQAFAKNPEQDLNQKLVSGIGQNLEQELALGLDRSNDLRTHIGKLIRVESHLEDQTFFYLDMDNDGVCEEISLKPDDSVFASVTRADDEEIVENLKGTYGLDYYCLTIGGVVEKGFAESLTNELLAFSLDGENILVGLFEEGPSGDPCTTLFSYQSGRINKIGSIDQDIRETQILGDGKIYGRMGCGAVQRDTIEASWSLDENGRIVPESKDAYNFCALNEVTLLEPLPVYEEPNKETMHVLPPGKVKFTRISGGFDWVELESEAGSRYWFQIEEAGLQETGRAAGLNKEMHEVFEGLNNAG